LSDATYSAGGPGTTAGAGHPDSVGHHDKIDTHSGGSMTDAAGPADAPTNRRIDQVAQSLKQAYQSTLDEAIPDTLMDLLRKLD
jgi:hypothetical protein